MPRAGAAEEAGDKWKVNFSINYFKTWSCWNFLRILLQSQIVFLVGGENVITAHKNFSASLCWVNDGGNEV